MWETVYSMQTEQQTAATTQAAAAAAAAAVNIDEIAVLQSILMLIW